MIDLVLVNGLPGSGKTTVATGLAALLHAPLISKDVIKEAVAEIVPPAAGRALGVAVSEMMWTLAAAMSGSVVLESWWFKPRDLGFVEAGLRRCRPASVVELWCDVPAEVAKTRFVARQRHDIHDDRRQLADAWPRWEAEAEPLGVGPVVYVDTHAAVDLADVARRIAQARNVGGDRSNRQNARSAADPRTAVTARSNHRQGRGPSSSGAPQYRK